MAIIGFIALVALALFVTVLSLSYGFLAVVFGSIHTSDKVVAIGLPTFATILWACAYFNAPFSIVFH